MKPKTDKQIRTAILIKNNLLYTRLHKYEAEGESVVTISGKFPQLKHFIVLENNIYIILIIEIQN